MVFPLALIALAVARPGGRAGVEGGAGWRGGGPGGIGGLAVVLVLLGLLLGGGCGLLAVLSAGGAFEPTIGVAGGGGEAGRGLGLAILLGAVVLAPFALVAAAYAATFRRFGPTAADLARLARFAAAAGSGAATANGHVSTGAGGPEPTPCPAPGDGPDDPADRPGEDGRR